MYSNSNVQGFFSGKIIVGPQEVQDPQFLLQFTLTHYILTLKVHVFWPPPYVKKARNVLFLALFGRSTLKIALMLSGPLFSDWVSFGIQLGVNWHLVGIQLAVN